MNIQGDENPVIVHAPATFDLASTEVEIWFERGGTLFIDVRNNSQSLSIEGMELVGRKMQIRLGPDWNRS